jgi:hypothetical protein
MREAGDDVQLAQAGKRDAGFGFFGQNLLAHLGAHDVSVAPMGAEAGADRRIGLFACVHPGVLSDARSVRASPVTR